MGRPPVGRHPLAALDAARDAGARRLGGPSVADLPRRRLGDRPDPRMHGRGRGRRRGRFFVGERLAEDLGGRAVPARRRAPSRCTTRPLSSRRTISSPPRRSRSSCSRTPGVPDPLAAMRPLQRATRRERRVDRARGGAHGSRRARRRRHDRAQPRGARRRRRRGPCRLRGDGPGRARPRGARRSSAAGCAEPRSTRCSADGADPRRRRAAGPNRRRARRSTARSRSSRRWGPCTRATAR